jgi:hypothetical protein
MNSNQYIVISIIGAIFIIFYVLPAVLKTGRINTLAASYGLSKDRLSPLNHTQLTSLTLSLTEWEAMGQEELHRSVAAINAGLYVGINRFDSIK